MLFIESMRNPFDENEPLNSEEADLARGILKLAEDLQDQLYGHDGAYISAKGKTVLDSCYRALRQTVKAYFGDECGLFYDPKPGLPFVKKTEGK